MTSPGLSPPRSKKESSDADEALAPLTSRVAAPSFVSVAPPRTVAAPSPTHALEVASAAIEAEIGAARPEVAEIEHDRGADQRAMTSSRREAKALARAQRSAARDRLAEEKKARKQARADAAAAQAVEVLAPDESATDETLEEHRPDMHRPDMHSATSAPDVAKQDAKDAVRRERARAKAAAQQAKAVDRAAKHDRIVEAPREPRTSLAQRLGGRSPKRPGGGVDAARGSQGRGRGRRVLSVLAGVIGAVGLICSVILAFGALLVALDADGGTVYDVVSGICDVLVGPLRDVFSFSGANADIKESLVAWGAGSITYLVAGIALQSMLRSAADD